MKIGLISCVKTKLNTKNKVKAEDLYTSDLFKKSYQFCTKNYDKTFILSAEYGLLELFDLVLPYEKTLNTMNILDRENWYNVVAKKLKNKINDYDILYYHCGINYREGLIKKLNNPYFIPLKGLSFGNQLKFYKNQLNDQLKLL